MATQIICDTSFLIDLQRERLQGKEDGAAAQFLGQHQKATLAISAITVGEFAEGFPRTDDHSFSAWMRMFEIVPIDQKTALVYGLITRQLREKGLLIGTNDLWIAATAMRHDSPLVTRNRTDFARIRNLDVLAY